MHAPIDEPFPEADGTPRQPVGRRRSQRPGARPATYRRAGRSADFPYVVAPRLHPLELLPIAEQCPFVAPGAYQGGRLYAHQPPSAAPTNFRPFVNRLHAVGLGLLLPTGFQAIFPKDSHGLAFFDGLPISYEHADPRTLSKGMGHLDFQLQPQ